MVCQGCTESLTALMDRELPPDVQAELEAHLKSCPACRAEQESFSASHGLPAQLPELDPPDRIWRAIEADLAGDVQRLRRRAVQPRPSGLRRLLPKFWLPATAAAGIVGGFLLFQAYEADSRRIEAEFTTYIQQREQRSTQNQSILFDPARYQRYQPERNPFMQPVQFDRNPFRSTPR